MNRIRVKNSSILCTKMTRFTLVQIIALAATTSMKMVVAVVATKRQASGPFLNKGIIKSTFWEFIVLTSQI